MKRLAIGLCFFLFALVTVGAAQNDKNELTGFYVGGTIGGAFGHGDVQTGTTFSPTGYFASSSVPAIATAGSKKADPKGFVGGGTIGYSHQFDQFFVGIESDFGAMNLDETVTSGATYPCCAPTAFSIKQNISTGWLITIRPRIGFMLHRAAVYGTVGPAFTNLSYSGVFTDTFATAHESAKFDENRLGYAAGGGVEYPVTHRFSIKGEYLYMGFGSASTTSANLTAFTPPIAFPTNIFGHSVDLNAQVVRAGFNYHF